MQLYLDFGIHLKPIFDTQLAHTLIQKQAENIVQQISYNHLCEEHELPVNISKEDIKKVYKRDQKFWMKRPLTKMMIDYAKEDVRSLLTIRENQLNQLSEENKSLVETDCNKLVQTLIQKNKETKNNFEAVVETNKLLTAKDRTIKKLEESNQESKIKKVGMERGLDTKNSIEERDKVIEQADEIEILKKANINAFKTIENISQQVERCKKEIEMKDIIIKNKDKKLDNYKKTILEQTVAIQKKDKKNALLREE